LNLEQTLTSRDSINTQLRGVLDEATGPWGIRVARVEIKAIEPPASIRDAMEKQMRADRDKRAIILSAEGQRESAIKTAEGQKAAQILSAEGQKQAVILAAEADRQSRILRAEGDRAARYLSAQGQAKAIETTFGAIHAAKPDPALLAYQYLQTLPQIAQGDANKMWIVPSEFSKALEGLAKLGGDDGAGAPSWLAAQSTGGPSAGSGEAGNTGGTASAASVPIDTSDWFDSKLPPASEQPEASNFRASDSDPESRQAHSGMTPESFSDVAGAHSPLLAAHSAVADDSTGHPAADHGRESGFASATAVIGARSDCERFQFVADSHRGSPEPSYTFTTGPYIWRDPCPKPDCRIVTQSGSSEPSSMRCSYAASRTRTATEPAIYVALTERLDYLQWLGVDCLWLPPFFPSPLRDGGYDVADFAGVLPEFGTLEDFSDFLQQAHARVFA